MSSWGLFSLLIASVVGSCVLAFAIFRDIRRGTSRPRRWLGWAGAMLVGLALASLAILRAEA